MAQDSERILLTYADLKELPEDRNRYELYEGELAMTAAPTPRHQEVVGNLYAILRQHVLAGQLGLVLLSPVDVRLSDIAVVEPDLLFISRGREAIVGERYVEGPPDLVVEVASPSTESRDRRTKRLLYARYAIPNYWIVDTVERSIEGLAVETGRYRVTARAVVPESFAAPPFANLTIRLAEVFGLAAG